MQCRTRRCGDEANTLENDLIASTAAINHIARPKKAIAPGAGIEFLSRLFGNTLSSSLLWLSSCAKGKQFDCW